MEFDLDPLFHLSTVSKLDSVDTEVTDSQLTNPLLWNTSSRYRLILLIEAICLEIGNVCIFRS